VLPAAGALDGRPAARDAALSYQQLKLNNAEKRSSIVDANPPGNTLNGVKMIALAIR